MIGTEQKVLIRDKNKHESISVSHQVTWNAGQPLRGSSVPRWTDDPKCNVKTGSTNKLRVVSGGHRQDPQAVQRVSALALS